MSGDAKTGRALRTVMAAGYTLLSDWDIEVREWTRLGAQIQGGIGSSEVLDDRLDEAETLARKIHTRLRPAADRVDVDPYEVRVLQVRRADEWLKKVVEPIVVLIQDLDVHRMTAAAFMERS